MPSLSHQKAQLERQQQKLQQQQARLLSKSQKLKTLERKQRTRRLIELGGLVVKAQLEDLNNNTLLGALLSLKKQMSSDTNILNDWTDLGAKAFEENKQKNAGSMEKIALILTFEAEPPRELKSQLRDLNFKWNPFRKEWYGYGVSSELETLIHPHGGSCEPCES